MVQTLAVLVRLSQATSTLALSKLFTSVIRKELTSPHGTLHAICVCPCPYCVVCSIGNVFIIGDGKEAAVSLPKGKGIQLSIVEERENRQKKAAKHE